MLKLFDKYNDQKMEIPSSGSGTQQKELQSDNVLSLSFTSYECVSYEVGDYIDFCDERFWVVGRYTPKQVSTVEWEYSVQLYGIESLIKQFLVVKTVNGDCETEFSYTATAYDHVALIVDCINSGMGTTDWKVGEVVASEYITIDYEGTYCDEGLRTVAGKKGVEYWIDGTTVNVCRCEHGAPITLGYNNGLTNVYKEKAANVKFFTRLFPIGTTRNIVEDDYGHSRLQLPDGVKYLDQDVDKFGVIHHYEREAFAHIYPRRVGTISSVRSEERTGDDGNPYTIYYFKDASLNFNPNDYEIAGLVKSISFQDGSDLAGRDFEVNYNSSTHEFEIITQWPYDNNTQLPNEQLRVKVGDKYILWNIKMPVEYYALAEAEYKEAVDEYIALQRKDITVYKAHTDYVDIDERELNLTLGQRVRLEHAEYFKEDGYRDSRITKITRNAFLPSDMDIEISDVISKGGLEKINDSVADVMHYTKVATGGIPQMIRSWESTMPTDTNLFSARKIVMEFVSKLKDDIVKGVITFVKGIITSSIKSANYTSGPLGVGYAVVVDALTGLSSIEVDNIYARRKAYFDTLEINKEQSNSGNQSYVAAHMLCTKVVEHATYYRCYFKADDGDMAKGNDFVVGDFARSKTFNTKASGSEDGFANRYYWRAVVGKGADYIDLSKALRDTASDDAPQAGDTISQLGNDSDVTRQNAIIFESVGTGAPSFRLYKGINSFDLSDKEMVEICYNPETGRAQLNSYGDAWIGSRRRVDDGNHGTQLVKYQGLEVDGDNVNIYANTYKTLRAKTDEPEVKEFVDLSAESLSNKIKAEAAQVAADAAQVDVDALNGAFTLYQGTVSDKFAEQRTLIDGEISTWKMGHTLGAYANQYEGYNPTDMSVFPPTAESFPAEMWTTPALKKTHELDSYLCLDKNSEYYMKAWRYIEQGGNYSWELLSDSENAQLLALISGAQATANSKSTTYLAKPTSGYAAKDTWILGSGESITLSDNKTYGEGDMLVTSSTSNVFVADHWSKAIKYTDDSKLDATKIGSGNLFNQTQHPTDTSVWNYGMGSPYEDDTIGAFSARVVKGQWQRLWQKRDYEAGKYYTYRCMVKKDASLELDEPTKVSFYISGSNFSHVKRLINGIDAIPYGAVLADEYQLLEWTVKCNNTVTNNADFRVEYYTNNHTVNRAVAVIYASRMVEGDKITEGWVPSYNDTQNQIKALDTKYATLNTEISDALENGLTTQEKNSIREAKKAVDSQYKTIEPSYSSLIANDNLNGGPLTALIESWNNLEDSKATLDTSVVNLLSTTANPIPEGLTNAYTSAYTDFDTKLAAYSTASSAAQKAIEAKIKSDGEGYTDGKIDGMEFSGVNLLDNSKLVEGVVGTMRGLQFAAEIGKTYTWRYGSWENSNEDLATSTAIVRVGGITGTAISGFSCPNTGGGGSFVATAENLYLVLYNGNVWNYPTVNTWHDVMLVKGNKIDPSWSESINDRDSKIVTTTTYYRVTSTDSAPSFDANYIQPGLWVTTKPVYDKEHADDYLWLATATKSAAANATTIYSAPTLDADWASAKEAYTASKKEAIMTGLNASEAAAEALLAGAANVGLVTQHFDDIDGAGNPGWMTVATNFFASKLAAMSAFIEDLIAKRLRTAETGKRVEIMGNDIKIYADGRNEPSVIIDGDAYDEESDDFEGPMPAVKALNSAANLAGDITLQATALETRTVDSYDDWNGASRSLADIYIPPHCDLELTIPAVDVEFYCKAASLSGVLYEIETIKTVLFARRYFINDNGEDDFSDVELGSNERTENIFIGGFVGADDLIHTASFGPAELTGPGSYRIYRKVTITYYQKSGNRTNSATLSCRMIPISSDSIRVTGGAGYMKMFADGMAMSGVDKALLFSTAPDKPLIYARDGLFKLPMTQRGGAVANNSQWYRKWNDGTMSCYGIIVSGANSDWVTLPHAFASDNYIIQITPYVNQHYHDAACVITADSKTAGQFHWTGIRVNPNAVIENAAQSALWYYAEGEYAD